MINIVFLGPPGSGKGTQARFIHTAYQLHLIGMGDLLREEIKQGTEIGRKIKNIIESGGFPANTLVFEVLKAHLFSNKREGGYVFDGIPRDLEQAQTLDALLGALSQTLSKAIYLEVDDQTLLKRIQQRYMCASCGAVYGQEENAPQVAGTCDQCGGTEFTRRKDDEESVFLQRLSLHKAKEGPVIDYYQKQGLLFAIDGAKGVSLIQKQIQDLFQIIGG